MKNINKNKGYLIVTAFWLAILTFCSLKTQAQSSCDSTMSYTVGSQYQLEIAFGIGGNNLSTWSAPLYVVTYGGGNMLAEDSCFANVCTHMIYNYNMSTGMPYDTLTTCVSYIISDSLQNIDTLWCCFDQYWDGQAWARLMMQQQNFSCDSISYFVDQGPYFNTNLVDNYNNPDSSMISWSVCNATTCYTGEGTFAPFPMIQPTDTLKVCYDAYLYYGNAMEVCNQCDSMVYSQGNSQWVLYSYQGNTTGISELEITRLNDNKMYDLLGRELTEIPVGQMYIRNQKLYINK
jgi:hypothetical protein